MIAWLKSCLLTTKRATTRDCPHLTKIVIFYLLICSTIPIRADNAPHEEQMRLQGDKAWALSNLGENEKAEDIYRSLIQEPEVPLEIAFNYLDLLVAQQRYQETIQHFNTLLLSRLDLWMLSQFRYRGDDPQLSFLAAMQKKYQSKTLGMRYAIKQAELLVANGKYQEAVHWIADHKEEKGNKIYAAYFSALANNRDDTAALIEQVIGQKQYTHHEQQQAQWLGMDMDRFWRHHITTRVRYIDNKLHGTFFPWENELQWTLGDWGRLNVRHYQLKGRNQFELSLAQAIALQDTLHFSVLSSDNKLGAKMGWQQQRIGFYQIGLTGFYQDVEKDITVLLKDFALKNGGEISGFYKLSPKHILGSSYVYNDYYLPNGNALGHLHIFHPYFVYIIKDKNQTKQHGIGWLHITGKGHADYIVHTFDMPYYVFSSLYYFGPYKSFFKYSLSLGYMRGKDFKGSRFQGIAFTPELSLRYSLSRYFDVLGGLEYRLDALSGDGEVRGHLGLNWRF